MFRYDLTAWIASLEVSEHRIQWTADWWQHFKQRWFRNGLCGGGQSFTLSASSLVKQLLPEIPYTGTMDSFLVAQTKTMHSSIHTDKQKGRSGDSRHGL
jgi:hypothetical protein